MRDFSHQGWTEFCTLGNRFGMMRCQRGSSMAKGVEALLDLHGTCPGIHDGELQLFDLSLDTDVVEFFTID